MSDENQTTEPTSASLSQRAKTAGKHLILNAEALGHDGLLWIEGMLGMLPAAQTPQQDPRITALEAGLAKAIEAGTAAATKLAEAAVVIADRDAQLGIAQANIADLIKQRDEARAGAETAGAMPGQTSGGTITAAGKPGCGDPNCEAVGTCQGHTSQGPAAG